VDTASGREGLLTAYTWLANFIGLQNAGLVAHLYTGGAIEGQF
jgi:hypothetical protein